jgi:hypothetical protein
MLAPLDRVPLRTLTRLAAKLKSSNDEGQKSLGIFLDRVQAINEGKSRPRKTDRRIPAEFSSLKDLRD